MRRFLRILKWLAMIVIVLAIVVVGWAFYVLQSSKPTLEGELQFSGLQAPVQIERDAAGVPRVTSSNRLDAAFATGFLHAQERFYQMDLGRRIGAGELAELFGSNVLPLDENIRRHQLRRTAEQALLALPDTHRQILSAYVDGANAGLATLDKAPLEYTITGVEPRPWEAADSLLVILYMFVLLQDSNGDHEYARHALYDSLPEPVAAFLDAGGTRQWDAPINGPAVDEPPIPGADVFSLRDRQATGYIDSHERASISGSNSWAMSGTLTSNGAAIVANDMHLGFYMPSMFYRMELLTGTDQDTGQPNRLAGITLPGLPFLVAGSNGHIAWGLTNSAGDWTDTVLLEAVDEDQTSYQGINGRQPLETVTESIAINGEEPYELEFKVSPWGPVHEVLETGDLYAIQWVAQYPRAVNLGMLELETIRSTGLAMDVAADSGIPAQNIIIGDRDGNIGWTIAGAIPRRLDDNGYFLQRSSEPGAGWSGWLFSWEYPQIYNPENGRLWTANARVVGGEDLEKIGHGYYVLGARAQQIRDRLFDLEQADEAQMLAIQMDHRALFLQRWAELLQQTVAGVSDNPKLTELGQRVSDWGGLASHNSQAYPYIRGFRDQLLDRAFAPYVEIVRQKYPEFELEQLTDQLEGPLWKLVSEQPAHLLPSEFDDWHQLLLTSLIEATDQLSPGDALSDASWGDSNRLNMRHLMSEFVPGFGGLFDMPAAALNGDRYMPLSQQPDHGPVQRFVVRPGLEQQAILNTPGGQSGNPMTAYYDSAQQAWLEGAATGLLAAETKYRLRLLPK